MTSHKVLSSGAKIWKSLPCPVSEVRLDLTLACGQTFRWKETAEGHWTGVMHGRVWTLTQTDDRVWYHVYSNQTTEKGDDQAKPTRSVKKECNDSKSVKSVVKLEVGVGRTIKDEQQVDMEAEILCDYLQLRVKLGDLYKEWGAVDSHFQQIAHIFTGVRMLRQDPTECLFSFICTSNNHISRIQGMIERLCQALGAPLCQLDQTSYYDFPTLTALADSSVEAHLRDLGFGYRARFIQQSAKKILELHGSQWLEGLRTVSYPEAREALRTLPGVGTKVADCVCLMSLDKPEAVPVDTHVWQIARRDYKFSASNGQKSLTDKLHKEIGDFFRKEWGPYAGWAHSVLFCADLKKFQSLKESTSKNQPKKEEKSDRGFKKAEGKRYLEGNERKSKLKCGKKTKVSVKSENGT